MDTKVVRYIYRYGILNFARRLLGGQSYLPKGIGQIYFLRYGVSCSPLRSFTLRGRAFKKLCSAAKEISVVVTFSWEGGAVKYVDNLIYSAEKSKLLVLCVPTVMKGIISCTCWTGGEKKMSFFSKGFSFLVKKIVDGKVSIVVNELVSWEMFVGQRDMTESAMGEILNTLIALKEKLECNLLYLVHDYLSICPRWTLTDKSSYYCDCEYSLLKCAKCLKSDDREYRYKGGIDIRKWRSYYERFFSVVDEVRTFSKDSRDRMQKVFPIARLTIVPHVLVGGSLRKPRMTQGGITVGVFGRPLKIKGVEMVDQLEAYAKNVGRKDVRIARITDYARDEMPDIVEREGINVALFSSVCPETFSYVVQELMDMRLPIVCYNLGAPAQRISVYEKGLVIPRMSPDSTLETIDALMRKLRLLNEDF